MADQAFYRLIYLNGIDFCVSRFIESNRIEWRYLGQAFFADELHPSSPLEKRVTNFYTFGTGTRGIQESRPCRRVATVFMLCVDRLGFCR